MKFHYDRNDIIDISRLLINHKFSISRTFDVLAGYGMDANSFQASRKGPTDVVRLIERIQEALKGGAADGEAVWEIFTEQKDGAIEVVEHTPTTAAPRL